jgi:hypothetical protein
MGDLSVLQCMLCWRLTLTIVQGRVYPLALMSQGASIVRHRRLHDMTIACCKQLTE